VWHGWAVGEILIMPLHVLHALLCAADLRRERKAA
jgi:hypothetical protein